MFRTILRKYTSSHFFLLYLAVFVSILAFSSVFPLLPRYAKMFQASDLTIGFLAASFAFAQFLFSPVWGKLSDVLGRKKIIDYGLLGVGLTLFAFGLAQSLTWLFVTRFLQGVFSAAVIPTARAYIADITAPEDRVRAMGRLGGSLSLGFMFGPALGGLLAEESISLPFFAASAITGLNFLFVFLFLPESLRLANMAGTRIRKRSLINLTYLWQGLKSAIAPLFLLSFVWALIMTQNYVGLPLLALEKFSMGPRDLGLIFTVMGIIAALTQFVLLNRMVVWLGKYRAIVAGFLLLALGFFLIALVPLAGFLYIAAVFVALGSSFSRPTITALITQETKQAQGITMGITAAFESFGRILGPLLAGFLFALNMHYPFLVASLLAVAVITLIVSRNQFLKA